MRNCPGCGESVETRFRYCPWCAAPQRLKLTEFFPAHAGVECGRDRALRVSRYLDPEAEQHVRFSVWNGDRAAIRVEAAVSLPDDEAERLARFLLEGAHPRYDGQHQPSIRG